jgi:hypothetical protein
MRARAAVPAHLNPDAPGCIAPANTPSGHTKQTSGDHFW